MLLNFERRSEVIYEACDVTNKTFLANLLCRVLASVSCWLDVAASTIVTGHGDGVWPRRLSMVTEIVAIVNGYGDCQ